MVESILGTVQFGTHYGVKNKSESDRQLTEPQVHQILDLAFAKGIRTFDTARDYGSAETILGTWSKKNEIRILTKIKDASSLSEAQDFFGQSLEKLGVENVYSLSLHVFPEVLKDYNLTFLEDLKKRGLVQYTGVSVYTNQEMDYVIQNTNVDIIQFPFNILDNLSRRHEMMNKAKKRNCKLHVRSIFLQGLLLMNDNQIPENLKIITPTLKQIQILASQFQMTVQELCLAYAYQNQLLDGVIFGVDSQEQLQQNLILEKKIRTAPLDLEEVEKELRKIELPDQTILNPSLWKK